jgi:hypothetical protein
MELGIFAKTYARDSLQATLDAVQADGLRTVQFNLVLTGGSSLPGRVPAELAGRVAADLRRRDLRMGRRLGHVQHGPIRTRPRARTAAGASPR